MRSTAADRCWQEVRSVLMELFYQGLTSHDGRYFIFVWTSRGRHISEAASGKERQDEMEYQPMGSSRATGVAKRRKTRFCSRVEEENQNPGRDVGTRGGERHAKACWDYLHVAGMEMASLDRDLRECMPCSAPIARSQFAGECRIMNFFDKHAIQSFLVFASSYKQNFINFDEIF